jgi:hypothetical protein
MPRTAAPTSGSYAEQLINIKHREYDRAATRARRLYYLTRWTSGIASIVMGIVVLAATGLTLKLVGIACPLAILLCTLIDTIHDPKGRWKLFSSATDRLALAELRRRGEYDAYEEQLRILQETENAKLDKLTDLAEVSEQIRKARGSIQ